VHTWTNTQNEGWFRVAFDRLQIPYDYISDQKLRATANLRDKWDVILFGPVGGTAQRIVNGLPMRGDPIPWKNSDTTPNLGSSPDTTDDMRGGMGLEGLVNVARFIDAGGLFITITGNASIPIDYGIIEGVAIASTPQLRASGSVIDAVIADKRQPDCLWLRGQAGRLLQPGAGVFGECRRGIWWRRAWRITGIWPSDRPRDAGRSRHSARTPLADGLSAGRAGRTSGCSGRGAPLPPELRPRVVVRFAGEKDLLVSGMLAGGSELADQAAVVDVPRGQGHVLLFANNPMWRNETQGSYFLLFNAMLNFDHLGVGR